MPHGQRKKNTPDRSASIEERTLTVSNLRGVSGGCYAGGFFGLAQVGSVAEVGSSDSTTNVLGLIQAGNVSLLDVFRTYIYHATVTGVNDGITIFANDRSSTGTMSTYQESGAAGGFGGGLMNGTVENSSVSDLNFVQSPNYSGGFIGMCGTSSGIGVDDVKAEGDESQANLLTALGLDLSTNPQLLNVVGSTVTNCCGFSRFDSADRYKQKGDADPTVLIQRAAHRWSGVQALSSGRRDSSRRIQSQFAVLRGV